MRSLIVLIVAAVFALSATAQHTDNEIMTIKSRHDFATTLEKLYGAIDARGLKRFDTIQHSKGAAAAGLDLRPTALVLFGSPKVGTPVMQGNQLAGLDLPMRMLVFEGEDGQTYLAYRQPGALVKDFALNPVPPQIAAMVKGLMGIAEEAAGS